MISKKIIVALLGLFLAGLALYGCGSVASSGGGTVSYSVINGTVKDTSGNALSGVRVTTSVATADTNSQGYFSLSNVSTTREVVIFSQSGKMTTQRVVSLTAGQAVFVDAVMVPANTAQSVSATSGGTVSGNSAASSISGSVVIPGNSLTSSVRVNGVLKTMAVTGNVNVAVTPFDPTNTSIEAFPSGFTGISSTGATVPFKTFGFVNVTITDASGNAVNLGSGKTATVKLGVATALQSAAATIGTIPLWFINTDGNWQQEGVATWDAATKMFVGIVAHFSSWNCDMPYSTTYVTGKVVDANGVAVPNAEVRIKAADNTWSSYGAYSKSDGTFGPIAVEAGVACQAYATKNGIRSATKAFTSGAAGATTDIGNLVLTAPLVQITLTWGANPADLDSHLTVPASVDAGPRYDLYYGNRSTTPTASWPYVNLDTDDTTSFGPEITSVYKLLPGTYRFNVHHYSGSSGISDSSANVNLIISGGGTSAIYNFTPPGGMTAVDDVWQVCDITVDANGNVTGVSTLNGVLHSISASDHASFSPGDATTVSAASLHAAELLKKK